MDRRTRLHHGLRDWDEGEEDLGDDEASLPLVYPLHPGVEDAWRDGAATVDLIARGLSPMVGDFLEDLGPDLEK